MRGMTRKAILIGLGLLAAGSNTAHALGVFETNLIVNPGAELGVGAGSTGAVVPVPGWITSSHFTVIRWGAGGGFPALSDPGPALRGLNFFAGGPINSTSTASQTINVSSGAAAIDAGLARFDLAGFLGGYFNQPDDASLQANFLSATNTSLGTAAIGPVTNADRANLTALLLRTTTGVVPVGTRGIQVTLSMRIFGGTYNDGYADELSLVLHSDVPEVPEPTTLTLLAGGLLGVAASARRKRRGRMILRAASTVAD